MSHSLGKISTSLLAGVGIAVVLLLIFIGTRYRSTSPDLQDYVHNMARELELLSGIRINLIKSEEAEKSAVMADTDEASQDFAKQSRMAADFVDRDGRELQSLLTKDHTDKEMKLFQEFETCWAELRRLDEVILTFAVQNTNLKAFALSFGKGREAMERFDHSLTNLMYQITSDATCCQAMKLGCDALTAGLRIENLQAPHIAASSDEQMDAIEAQIREEEGIVNTSLKELANLVSVSERASLAEAEKAYQALSSTTAEVLKLSRQNTNIKSFELSLGKKRKMAAQCDEILTGLQEAVSSREFKATR